MTRACNARAVRQRVESTEVAGADKDRMLRHPAAFHFDALGLLGELNLTDLVRAGQAETFDVRTVSAGSRQAQQHTLQECFTGRMRRFRLLLTAGSELDRAPSPGKIAEWHYDRLLKPDKGGDRLFLLSITSRLQTKSAQASQEPASPSQRRWCCA